MLAETLSLAKQAEAQRDLEIKKAQYPETVKRQQAQADKAYEIQTNIMQQQVVAEQVKVQQVEKEQQIKVQEAEIERREKELIATVLKQAEIERQRIETLADAERQRLDARGRGPRRRPTRDAGRRPRPRSSSRRAKPRREAMNVKAEAYQEVQPGGRRRQAAHGLPEIVRALAEPLVEGGQDHHRLDRQRRQRPG